MKNPMKLLRMGLVLGTFLAFGLPSTGQETGSAIKAAPLTITEAPQSSGTAAVRKTDRPAHKRLQKEPRNLPVSKTARLVRRATLAEPQAITEVEPQTLPILSPNPSFDAQALPDNGQVAPPDTFGAVGPGHLVVACASQIQISDRLGNVISRVSQEIFWASVAQNIFDTRVVYDPYGQRFIMTAAADPGGSDPRLCIAVSAGSNPTGTWYRWSENVDAGNPVYADSPTVGFNKTWIVVQANMFNKSTFEFFRSEVFAYNKANLYNDGSGQRTKLAFDPDFGGSQVPATTYDSTNAIVYFVENWNGHFTPDDVEFFGYLRVFSLSGGIGSERLNVTNSFGEEIFVEIGRTWAENATNDMDILPQLGSASKVYAGDSRIQNVHFRDGLLYAAQTVFLPSIEATRSAVQWWCITANSGEVRHFGRVDDATGTNMFAYPSIAANRYHDVLLGYSRFSPAQYPSTAYSFRTGDDPTDELRGEVMLKAGEATYDVPVFGQNRWGDWSATTVDPANDLDLWTIQEYAAPHSPGGGSRWGTWWGRVSPPVDLGITMTAAPGQVPSGGQITYTIIVTNKLDQILHGARVEDVLPPGVSYVTSTSSQGSCTHSGGVVTCSIGPMSEFERVTITITVNAGPPGSASNVATVAARGPDTDPSDNTAAVVTEILSSADLQVQGSENVDPVHAGNALTYTLSISNRGPSAAGGVVATSTLPASVTINNVTVSPGTFSINGSVVSFTLGVINSGGTALITIGCTPNVAGTIANQVRVAANTFDTVPANNTLSISTRVNARPVVNQLGTQTINEDVPTVIPITISDAETAAGSLQFSAVSSNPGLIPNSNIVPGGSGQNRNLTVTSAPNQFGSNTTTITVTVTDSDGASTLMTFPINVAAVNDAPTISNILNPAPINEDSFVSLNFTISDIDSPIGSLTLSRNSSNQGLVPLANIQFSGSGSSRTVTVTPDADRFGSSQITVTVSDGNLADSDSFVLNVNPVNDPPVISSIGPQGTSEDTASPNIQFTVSDPETPAGSLSVVATSSDTTIVPNANITSVNQGADRSIRITPAADKNGTVSITVRVSDGTNSVTTGFDLTIAPVNDRPTLAQPPDRTIDEDEGRVSVPLAGIGSGAANENQTLNVSASTTTPQLVENLQVIYTSPDSTGMLIFDTVANAAGTAFIDIIVSDGISADDFSRRIEVVINGINDPPTIDPLINQLVLEDSGQQTITLTGITTGAANEVNQTIVITADSSAPGIVPDPQIIHVPGALTATLHFTPRANASGIATITLTLDDGRPLNPTTVRTFQITVEPVNDLPTISFIGDTQIAEDAGTGAIPFNFDDVEPGALTLAAFSSNQGLVPDGNLAITGSGTNRNLTATPLADQFGQALITVRVTDTEGGVMNESFVLTVDPVNDPPTLASIPGPLIIEEDAPAQTVNLGGISPGPPNEGAQAVLVTAASSNPSVVPHPSVSYASPAAAGLLTFTPVANATGSAVITVTANDQQGLNNQVSRTFTVQVNPVNDPPAITGNFDDQFTDEDVPAGLTFTISDVETPAGNLTVRGASTNPELVADAGITFAGSGATRTVTVRPLTNGFGSTFIILTVRDSNGDETETGFVLFVNEVDDSPLLAAPANRTIAEDGATGALQFWLDDIDTPVGAVVINTWSSDQEIVPDENIIVAGSGTNRNIQVTPAANAFGPVTIFIKADDGNTATTSEFALTVSPVNDRPTLDDLPSMILLEDAGQQEVALTVGPGALNESSDVLSVTAVSSLPGVIPNPIGVNVAGVWKLRFTPAANASGQPLITVTVIDGRPTNSTVLKTFQVTVQPVNDPPTLDPIATLNLSEDPPQQNVTLTGISAGGGEAQSLTFNAASSDPALVSHPTISYTDGNPTGVLRFTVAGGVTGNATITVRLSDGTDEVVQSFAVNVNDVNDAPVFVSTIPNLTTPEDTPINAPFTLMDEESYSARLTLTAISTNTTLVPNANIVIHGSDSNRWVTITPATNLFGLTRITVTASDGTNNSSMSFNLTVTSVNDAPTLNPPPNRVLTENPPNQTISFTGIGAGAANESQTLTVRVTSSNPSLVPPPSSVSYTSPNTTGSFVLNPANQGTGSSLITVRLSDNGSPSNGIERTFTVYIRPTANSLPALTGLIGRSTPEDTPITFSFGVNDSATPVSSLIVGAQASNQDLVPPDGIAITGTTTTRSMTITPAANRFGTTTITVWVLDDQSGYTSSNFVFQVMAANDRPTISPIPAQFVNRGTNMPPVAFTIEDAETPAHFLTVAATSSNQGLLPNGNIVLGGSGTDRSIMAYPVPGQIGSATINVTVTDGNSLGNNTSFVLTVSPPQPPALTLRRAGLNVELRWPAAAGLYTLQGRDQLNAGTWLDIVATPSLSGTDYLVIQPLSGPRKFFRLRH